MMIRNMKYGQRQTRLLQTLILIGCLLGINIERCYAQDLTISVTPTYEILPPQLGLYVDSPEKYFKVWVTNNTEETQNVFFGMQLEEVTAGNDLVASTRANHMPKQPIVIPAGQTVLLSSVQMHNLFNYLPMSDIFIRSGIYKQAKNGVVGLMPEGTYALRMTAYKWDPTLTSPVALNNPNDGTCLFRVCYSAQAPTFLQPAFSIDQGELNDYNIAMLSTQNPMISWRAPVMACSPQVQFSYELRIVELIPGQTPDDAMAHGAEVYDKTGLLTTTFLVPQALQNKLKKESLYAAQVIASTNTNEGDFNYVSVNNDGKSSWLQFRVTDGIVTIPEPEPEDTTGMTVITSQGSGSNLYENDSLYVFRVPKLTKPEFVEGQARKVFMNEDIPVEWRKTWFEGGRGERQDTIKWKYSVQLYKGETSESYTEIFSRRPIFSEDVTELKSKIPWDKIEKEVQKSDFLILRVLPTCLNEESIRVIEDSTNIKTFAIVDRLSQVFQCTPSGGVKKNLEPTKEKIEKGKKVGIGAYNLTLDKVQKVPKKDCYSGTGHIEWTPAGLKIGVAVKFDSLYINSDNLVYEGTCVTYSSEEEQGPSNSEVVDELFSDWGLDNIIGDTQIPYASQIQEGLSGYGKDGLKAGADALNLSQYYNYYKIGKTAWNFLSNGEISDCHMPLQIPEEYNSSPVDIMIASMTFSPTTAYMNLIGMFQMPESNKVDSILVFGAPALCMNPESLIPETGMMALISNFTLTEPKSGFKFTFKAPNDVSDPTNGCFLKWEDSTIDVFNAEIEMRIPKLKRVEGDQVLDELPRVTLTGRIRNWSNWMADVKMDAFQAEDLPGWTFVPGQVAYDHSLKENPSGFKFPARYNKKQAKCPDNDNHWEGLYIRDMEVRFPKVIAFDEDKEAQEKINASKGDTKSFAVVIDYVMHDCSGFSASFGLKNILSAKCGGWKITVDKVNCDVVQNNFDNCGFDGRFTVPLLKQAQANPQGKHDVADIAYQCKMYLQEKPDKSGKEAVYIFATTQTCDLSLDFFLATAQFDQKQTYFLVESTEDTTKVELCLGGKLSINSSDKLKLKIPDISFSRMRLANCQRWESKYLKNNSDLYKEIFAAKAENSKPDNKAGGGDGKAGDNKDGSSGDNKAAGDNKAGGDAKAGDNKAGDNKAGDNKNKDNDANKNVLFDGREFVNNDSTVYFDIGKWSHASPEKKVGGFAFSLEKFDMVQNGDLVGLQIGGGLKCLEGKLTAETTITINAKVDMSALDISYEGIKFDGAKVHSEFGGVKIEGEFNMPDTEDEKGFEASLDLTMPGDLFSFHAAGAWMEKEKDETEKALERAAWDRKEHDAGAVYNPSDSYTWAYLVVSMASENGIQAPPIQINGIKGGFYFNCRNKSGEAAFDDSPDDNGTPAFGMVGGLLGLKISTTGSSKAINADMQLTMFYDMFEDRLSTISMVGNVHALSAKNPDDGLINAKAKLIYQHDEKSKYLDLDITADGTMDMKDKMREFAGAAMDSLMAVSNKVGLEALGAPKNGPNSNSGDSVDSLQTANDMADLKEPETPKSDPKSDPNGIAQTVSSPTENNGAGAEGDPNSTENKEEESVEEGKDNFEASMGFHVAMNFRITWRRNGTDQKPVKWHLYVGRPPHKERCELRLIDFKMGNKDDAFAMWATIGANAYLCLGNELVDEDGNEYGLPEIPETISKFLNGGDINGDQQHLSAEAEATRQGTIKEFKETGLNAKSDGGIMFGASAWGDFGTNAGIVYARATLMAGFDLALKKLADGQRCIGGKEMGSKGYYGTGQVYAYAAGEIGLLINCWLFKGKVPLVDAGLGALLRGGFPNPSWAYGKMRAKYRLLGGLIKGSTTVEMKVGEVCMPEFGNPLDDIKIFEDMQPGYEEDPETGFEEGNAISALASPRFTTNMVIDRHLRLLDKNEAFQMADYDEEIEKYGAQASRTYVFHLDKTMTMDVFDEPDPSIKKDAKPSRSYQIGYTTNNHTSYSLATGTMETSKGYRIRLMGYAKEVVNGKEIDPIFNDESTGFKDVSKVWRDTVTYFFRTNDVPPPVNEAVAIFHTTYRDDLRKPMLAMKYSYANMLSDPDRPLSGRLEVWNEEHKMWLCPDIKIETKTFDSNGNEVTASTSSTTSSSSSASSPGGLLNNRPTSTGARPTLGGSTSSLSGIGTSSTASFTSNPTTTKTVLSKPNSESEYYDLELREINQNGYIFLTTVKTLDIVERGKIYRFSLNLIDKKKMNEVAGETVDKFMSRKRGALSRTEVGGSTSKTSSIPGRTNINTSRKPKSSTSSNTTSSAGSTTTTKNYIQNSVMNKTQPETEPTVNLNDYLNDLKAEVEKEMGDDADTVRHTKFKEQYDKANYSTMVYSKTTGVMSTAPEPLHPTYNNFMEHKPAASGNAPYIYGQLKSVNYTTDPIYSSDSRLVDSKEYLKTPYGVMGYWLAWGFAGGVQLKDKTYFKDLYYLSSEGLSVTLDENGRDYAVAIRNHYGADGVLPQMSYDALAAIRQHAKNLQISMADRKYRVNPLTNTYYTSFSLRERIEYELSNDIQNVLELYDNIAAVKAKYLSFTNSTSTKKVGDAGNSRTQHNVRNFINTYNGVWSITSPNVVYGFAKDVLKFPYYQLPAIQQNAYNSAPWRQNQAVGQAVWDGIDNNKPTRSAMRSNIKSVTYETYRLTTFYSGIGYTKDTQYGIREEDRSANVYETTIPNASLLIAK